MKRSELFFIAIKPPLDFIGLVLAATVAYIIRYLPSVQEVRPVVFELHFSRYLSLSLIAALIGVGVFALIGLYSFKEIKKFRSEIGRVFVGCLAGLAVVLAVMVFSRHLFDSRFIILLAFGLSFFFVSFGRLIIKLFQKLAFMSGYGVTRIVLIGNGSFSEHVTRDFNDRPSSGMKIVERFASFSPETKQTLLAMVKNDQIDEIIQVNPYANQQLTEELLEFVDDHHLDYKYTADLLGTKLTNIEMTTIAGTPIVEVKKTKLDGWGRISKRIFDIVIGCMLIILFLPLMIFSALMVKLTSAGPVLFSYRRIGQHGKEFQYFKFRSMVADAHKFRFDPDFITQHQNLRDGSPMLKFKNDPRITPFGRFIRRFSIDELPELFLVLVGKMSLVGPRPHEIEEVQRYQRHHKKVLTIKPGITGMAQVSGRSDLDFEEEVKLDTFYIENWSLGLDLLILLKTPLAVLKKREAA